MIAGIRTEDLNPKRPRYNAWGIGVWKNVEKIIVCVSFLQLQVCTEGHQAVIIGFQLSTENGHFWNTNSYFWKNKLNRRSQSYHISSFHAGEVSCCDLLGCDTVYRSAKCTPMFLMNPLLPSSQSKLLRWRRTNALSWHFHGRVVQHPILPLGYDAASLNDW